jgi:hypothetical protein
MSHTAAEKARAARGLRRLRQKYGERCMTCGCEGWHHAPISRNSNGRQCQRCAAEGRMNDDLANYRRWHEMHHSKD